MYKQTEWVEQAGDKQEDMVNGQTKVRRKQKQNYLVLSNSESKDCLAVSFRVCSTGERDELSLPHSSLTH